MYKFAFTAGIGAHDNFIGTAEQFLNSFKLFHHAGIVFIDFTLAYLTGF